MKDFKQKIHNILKKVNKPSRYIGQEVGSFNKDWDTAEARAVLAFPDLYEIGISNLGLRILYDKINNYKERNLLADRVYAPEVDFRDELKKNNIPLYGLESFMPIKDFDLMALSLQYELSYPTILAMFEMSDIPIKSIDRDESHPIIAAGGPGSYNPEPISEFIDVFLIGDGETAIIEIMEEICSAKALGLSREETLRRIAGMHGFYVPLVHCHCEGFSPKQSKKLNNDVWIAASDFSSPPRNDKEFSINKRIDDIDNTDFPVKFPVPYMQAVHDRAVVEIRRGCGRMCRFCQPCFVNLPVRERSPEHIIEITENVLQNTGYDEYSLLSLSSNDYQNIEKLVSILNQKHACSGASISLPSQRADKFSLELAELVQSVRKSTVTFAPEAGSQRLRDVINKNLNEEQIIDAVLSVYKAGWQNVKLYFMIGLPTETYEDLDGIINLLKTIKDRARILKNELRLKKYLTITCTMSIFVPKPFTPFQWCGQDKMEVIEEKIRYIREKIRHVKDVKLNFHDSFLCSLEAAFSRGDKSLNSLVEHVYRQGSYLDAWREHFNKAIWIKAAESLSINFDDFASREFNVDEELAWDFLNVGVDKNWLIAEYKKALESENSVPCGEACSNCGVCAEFDVQPSLKSQKLDDCHCKGFSPKQSKEKTDENFWIASSAAQLPPRNDNATLKENNHRYRLKLQKIGDLKYISHLDWKKLVYGAIRKSGIKINFTQGFNPSPKFALAIALPLFIEGKEEFADIELKEKLSPVEIKERINVFLPENSKILEIVNISKAEISIDKTVSWAKYSALPADSKIFENINIKSIVKNHLLKENIIIEKKNHSDKKGLKTIDIRPAIHSLIVDESNGQYKLSFILRASNSCGTLRADEFLEGLAVSNAGLTANDAGLAASNDCSEINSIIPPEIEWNIVREKLLDNEFRELF